VNLSIRPPRRTPRLLKVARYWDKRPDIETILPNWRGLVIGLGEPFCGACGWLARVARANATNASVLVSIHFDGFSDPTVGGTETLYDSVRPFAATSKRLATDLQSALVAALGTADRGVWTDDQLAAPTLTSSGSTYGHL
jgi:hypothetical protein